MVWVTEAREHGSLVAAIESRGYKGELLTLEAQLLFRLESSVELQQEGRGPGHVLTSVL